MACWALENASNQVSFEKEKKIMHFVFFKVKLGKLNKIQKTGWKAIAHSRTNMVKWTRISISPLKKSTCFFW